MTTHDEPRTLGVSPASRRGRLGAVAMVGAALIFAASVAVAIASTGATYLWPHNMISDLGDSSCGVRGGRWICSPRHALFNGGVMVTGMVIAASALLMRDLWGRLLSSSVLIMGVGLLVAGGFNAGDHPVVHLAGVVLALVVPAAGLMISGFRPGTSWLGGNRVVRAAFGLVGLLLCAESRLPEPFIPQGPGQVVIVACVLVPLLIEAGRVANSSRSAD